MLHLPRELYEALGSASVGTRIFGTYDSVHQTGSLVALSEKEPETFVLPTLGRIGVVDPALPLVFKRNDGKCLVTDRHGVLLRLAPYEPEDFSRRNPLDPVLRAHLSDVQILIFGLGTIGAPFAIALAQAGVGQIAAADPDTLEVHNCMRHPLGVDYLGWNKARALGEQIEVRAPTCHFTPIPHDLLSGDRRAFRQLLDDLQPHGVVAVTDNKGAQYLGQMGAIYANALFLSMGCYDWAIEGEAFFRLPEKAESACYADLHPPQVDDRPPQTYDYSNDAPGRYAGEPALGHLISHKVDVAVTLFINALLRGLGSATKASEETNRHLERGAQYVRFGGPYITDPAETGLEKLVEVDHPWQVKWCRVRKREDCSICGAQSDYLPVLFPQLDGDEVEEVAPWGQPEEASGFDPHNTEPLS